MTEPWRVEAHSLYETNVVAGNKIIARVYGDDAVEEVALARKIAAAPRLLDALKNLVRACEQEDWDEPDRDLVAARTEIAKAEGRDS